MHTYAHTQTYISRVPTQTDRAHKPESTHTLTHNYTPSDRNDTMTRTRMLLEDQPRTTKSTERWVLCVWRCVRVRRRVNKLAAHASTNKNTDLHSHALLQRYVDEGADQRRRRRRRRRGRHLWVMRPILLYGLHDAHTLLICTRPLCACVLLMRIRMRVYVRTRCAELRYNLFVWFALGLRANVNTTDGRRHRPKKIVCVRSFLSSQCVPQTKRTNGRRRRAMIDAATECINMVDIRECIPHGNRHSVANNVFASAQAVWLGVGVGLENGCRKSPEWKCSEKQSVFCFLWCTTNEVDTSTKNWKMHAHRTLLQSSSRFYAHSVWLCADDESQTLNARFIWHTWSDAYEHEQKRWTDSGQPRRPEMYGSGLYLAPFFHAARRTSVGNSDSSLDRRYLYSKESEQSR